MGESLEIKSQRIQSQEIKSQEIKSQKTKLLAVGKVAPTIGVRRQYQNGIRRLPSKK